MRRFRFWPQMALVFAVGVLHGGCILIPEIKDRIVELAVSGTSSAVFTVSGSATSVDDTTGVNVGDELNLQKILDDAGIDTSQVTHIALSGISYRIVRADGDPTRLITNGTIKVRRGTGTEEALVTGFSAAPGAVSGFQSVTLDAAGVAVVNTLLDDILAALPGAPANPWMALHLAGDMSSDSGNPANFDVEIKITVSITGTVAVSVPT